MDKKIVIVLFCGPHTPSTLRKARKFYAEVKALKLAYCMKHEKYTAYSGQEAVSLTYETTQPEKLQSLLNEVMS